MITSRAWLRLAWQSGGVVGDVREKVGKKSVVRGRRAESSVRGRKRKESRGFHVRGFCVCVRGRGAKARGAEGKRRDWSADSAFRLSASDWLCCKPSLGALLPRLRPELQWLLAKGAPRPRVLGRLGRCSARRSKNGNAKDGRGETETWPVQDSKDSFAFASGFLAVILHTLGRCKVTHTGDAKRGRRPDPQQTAQNGRTVLSLFRLRCSEQ